MFSLIVGFNNNAVFADLPVIYIFSVLKIDQQRNVNF